MTQEKPSPFALLMGELFKDDIEQRAAVQWAAGQAAKGKLALTTTNGDDVAWARTAHSNVVNADEYTVELIKRIADDPSLKRQAQVAWEEAGKPMANEGTTQQRGR